MTTAEPQAKRVDSSHQIVAEAPGDGAGANNSLLGPFVVVTLITGIALSIRLFHLDFKSLWYDEALCYWVSHGTIAEVIEMNKAIRATPPMFTIITNLVLRVGESEFALRFVPMIAGVAVVPAMYWLARQFLSRMPSYLAMSLAAIAPSQVTYSQRLREYSLTMLFAVLTLCLYFRCLRRPTWGNFAVLSVSWVVALSIHYGLALLIGATTIVFLSEAIRSPLRRTLLTRWAAAISPLVVLGIFAFLRLGLWTNLRRGGPGVDSYLRGDYWQGTLRSFANLSVSNTLDVISFAASPGGLMVALVLLGIVFAWRSKSGRLAALALIVPMGCTFLAACLRLYPYGGGRHAIFLAPMIYVMAAAGVVCLAKALESRRAVILILLVLAAFSGRSTLNHLRSRSPQHIRPIVEKLESSMQPGDQLYVHFTALPAFRYYYKGDPNRGAYKSDPRSWIDTFSDQRQPEKDLVQLDRALASPARVWMVFIDHFSHREMMTRRAAKTREIELVAEDSMAWLYLAK